MIKLLKKPILSLIPQPVKNFIYNNHPSYKKTIGASLSFSQEGEDMILKRIYNGKTNGFYIDIGAHHPVNHSNTNYFYQQGWTGINIDATPHSMEPFKKLRPRDINLEMIISNTEGLLDFHVFDPSLMNTISASQAAENRKFEWCKFIETVKVESAPLRKVLDTYLPDKIEIDFMSIDVESAEMEVLLSNDWERCKPNVILVEVIDRSVEEILDTEVYTFLKSHDYVFFAKSGNTIFFNNSLLKEVFNIIRIWLIVYSVSSLD